MAFMIDVVLLVRSMHCLEGIARPRKVLYHNRTRMQETSDRGEVVSQGYSTRQFGGDCSDCDYRTQVMIYKSGV